MHGRSAGQWFRAAAMLALLLHCTVLEARAETCSKPVHVSSVDWEPYSYFDSDNNYRGLDVELTRAILKEAGCTLVEMVPMPSSRNTLLFEQGKVDLMAGASRTPAREEKAYFSSPYRNETVGMFILASAAQKYAGIKSFADFMTLRAALLAPRIGWYGQDYAEHMQELKDTRRLSQFGVFRQGMSMLAAGRASFILGDVASVAMAAERQGVKVQALPFWLVDAPVHLMLNKQSLGEADLRLIDAAIERLRKRGELERIRRAYGGN